MNKKPKKNQCVFPMFRNGKVYRWIVKYTVNKCRVYVGCFKTEAEAIAAYQLKLAKDQQKRWK